MPFMIEMGHDATAWQERSGWVGLTPAEASVAMLVEGLSSPEMAVNLRR